MCHLQASHMFLWQYFFMLVVMKVNFLLLFDWNWCVSIYTSRSLDADILQFWGVDGWNFSPNVCITGEYLKCSSSVRSKRCWICWKCPCSRYIYRLTLSTFDCWVDFMWKFEISSYFYMCRHAMSNLLLNSFGYILKWTSDLDWVYKQRTVRAWGLSRDWNFTSQFAGVVVSIDALLAHFGIITSLIHAYLN